MKIAWVTGGGTGIGRALAELLCDEGWQVAISGRRGTVLEQAARQINARTSHSGSVVAIPSDVSDAFQVESVTTQIHNRWGDVDLLINNAGVNPYHTFNESSPEEFEQIFRINCMSAILCAKSVLPGMRRNHRGAIINISSFLGKWGSRNSPAYSTSKFALTGLTNSLYQELAPEGIHVMGVYPGYIRTEMTQEESERRPYLKYLSASPKSMARAILRGLKHRKRELHYPGYVSLTLWLHSWWPAPMEWLYQCFRPNR